jgi:hypothetical protein
MKFREFLAGVMIAGVLVCGPEAARADVVQDWNAIALSAAAAQNPFNQARIVAITQLAVFEAVNSITGEYQPYLGTIVAPAGASASAAAIAAAHDVLKFYLPGSAATLDAARATSLAAITNGPGKDGGITVGQAAAAAMIAARVNDGSAFPEFYTPSSSAPGEWQITPGCPAGGVFLHWRNLTPFGIDNAENFRAGPPPALDSNEYAKDYNEVKRVGSHDSTERPQDRSDVARFFAASSPAYVMNLAARQLSAAQGRSLSHNARAFALINMAISDSFVASFGTKYQYTTWRPETAIHGGDTDGNSKTEPVAGWTPFIPAPCFPAYTSNHASGSYGGAEVLRRLYGAGGHSITLTNPAFPNYALHYAELKQITADIDDARVYGGIHFRFDQRGGARLGRDVATFVYLHNLRRVQAEEN